MKKLVTLLFALVATTALWAHDFDVNGIYYKILNGSEVAVTYRGSSYDEYADEYSGSVIIPSSVTYNGTTYSVTSIGEWTFYGCFSLTSVTIGNSVTNIGYAAFAYCSSLTSITIPNSVTSIGEDAFGWCSGLTSIVVEKGNTVYDSRENCNAIIETATNTLIAGCQNTIIPSSVTSIGDYAFDGCLSLTSITIPNSVTSIGEWAFYYCSGLTSITIPNSVTSIGDGAFAYCSSLTSVTIPNSVTSIGEGAFSSCESLTSVTSLAETPPTLGTNAFFKVSTQIPVYVPCESLANYQSAEGWSYFTNIQCMPEDESAVDNTHSQSPMTNCQKILRNGQLLIIRDGVEYNAMGVEL